MRNLKEIVLILLIIVILTGLMFTLSGCEVSAKTDSNSVSISVDQETKGTFKGILDWIQERIDRIFND